MSEATYQVVVNGKLVEGAELDQVKQNIAQLFKTSVDKIEAMFSGRPLAVKKGLDQPTALKYKAALNKAGLLAAVITEEEAATEPKQSALDSASIAAVGSMLDQAAPAKAPEIDTSAYAMGHRGETLDQKPAPAEPQIDISSLSMGKVGEDVTEALVVPEPQIDIDDLSMAEVGADVSEAEIVPEADIDTSELSMAEAGADVMQYQEVPPAQIDTSKLKLDD